MRDVGLWFMGIDGWDVRIWMAGNRVCNKKDTHASTQSTRGTDFSPDSTPKICRSETSFFTLGGVILCSAMTSLPSSRLGSCWLLGTHSFFLLLFLWVNCIIAWQPSNHRRRPSLFQQSILYQDNFYTMAEYGTELLRRQLTGESRKEKEMADCVAIIIISVSLGDS